MKNFLFILGIVILTAKGYGQLPEPLAYYYHFINKAELDIIDSNYSSACKNYEEAFSYNKSPFARDLYNEALCSFLLEDYDKVYANFSYLIDYGYQLSWLKEKDELKPFFKCKQGKKLLKYKSKQLHNVYLRQVYDSLFFADQFFRKKKGSYATYGDTISKIDDSNMDVILSLYKQHGFPSQKLVGVYQGFNYKSIYIMIIHNQVGMRDVQYYDFTKILLQSLKSGKLDARMVSQLVTGSTGVDNYGFMESGLIQYALETNKKIYNYSKWGFLRITKEQEKQINGRRQELGLGSIGDARKKAAYTMKDKRFNLNESAGKKIFTFSKDRAGDYKKSINQLDLIE